MRKISLAIVLAVIFTIAGCDSENANVGQKLNFEKITTIYVGTVTHGITCFEKTKVAKITVLRNKGGEYQSTDVFVFQEGLIMTNPDMFKVGAKVCFYQVPVNEIMPASSSMGGPRTIVVGILATPADTSFIGAKVVDESVPLQ